MLYSCHWEVLWVPLEMRRSTNVHIKKYIYKTNTYKRTELNGTCWEKEFLECSIKAGLSDEGYCGTLSCYSAFEGVRNVTLL